MSDIAIRVENLGKQYRIGALQKNGGRYTYKSLRDSIAGAASAPFRATRALMGRNGAQENHQEDTIWALKDVSFDVKHGEIVGVIGGNGAGKSTLLKILSRITEPTTGRVELRGRVGSLLEVGTGFHPELTGRDNVYLNGAILGMKRAEIVRNFDPIVAFAEVEKFIDTPVKHYSSGMYLRLAFAVAAHLQTEILMVDEVLAVGDAQFQKKCLGKMQDVANNEGRTVLFVSHNMVAIQSLCNQALLLCGGTLCNQGPACEIVEQYLSTSTQAATLLRHRRDREGNGQIRFTNLSYLDNKLNPTESARPGSDLVFALDFESKVAVQSSLQFEIGVYNQLDQLVFLCGNEFSGQIFGPLPRKGRLLCHVTDWPLPPGSYSLNVFCAAHGIVIDWVRNAATLQVVEGDFFGTGRVPPANAGIIWKRHSWTFKADV